MFYDISWRRVLGLEDWPMYSCFDEKPQQHPTDAHELTALILRDASVVKESDLWV